MAHSAKSPATSPASYHGEVWTDGRGYATVRLPAEAGPLEPPLEYELRDLEPPSNARVTSADPSERAARLERSGVPGRVLAWTRRATLARLDDAMRGCGLAIAAVTSATRLEERPR